MSNLIGIALGFAIGAACRWFDIPCPAPTRVVGALLVVATTAGFLVVDLLGGYLHLETVLLMRCLSLHCD